MKSFYFIDGWEQGFSTLKEAKTHVNDSCTEEEKNRYFRDGGYIYHVADSEVISSVEFEYINGNIHFHKIFCI